jgi:hypothetical protein
MMDILTNMDITEGRCRCHEALDILLTSTGDIALTEDDGQELMQRFLLYLAVPHGERYNPNIGCFLHDFLHEKITANNIRRLEQAIESDIKYQFPEVDLKSISCQISDSDPAEILIHMVVSSGVLQFLFTSEEMLFVSSEIQNVIHNNY